MQLDPPIDYRLAYPGLPNYNLHGVRCNYTYSNVPYFDDPAQPWLIHYGPQRVSVPQIGYDVWGWRYHPACGSVDEEGVIIWDWSKVVRGMPEIPWRPRLSPTMARAQWDPGHIAPPPPREPWWARIFNRDRFTGS